MAYTSHGHHIRGSQPEPPYQGEYVMCGGSAAGCKTCKRDSAMYFHPSNHNKKVSDNKS